MVSYYKAKRCGRKSSPAWPCFIIYYALTELVTDLTKVFLGTFLAGHIFCR